MYNRTNAYVYSGNKVTFDWFQFTYKGQKSVVVKELYTEGISLTNSIEGAIALLIRIFNFPIIIYQDCGKEGIFKIEYDYNGSMKDTVPDEYLFLNLSWHKFSDSLETMELLYAKA